MKCDTRMMIKTGVGIAAVLAIAYATLPAARELVTASAPILLALICPLSMIFMMKGMSSCSKQQDAKAENPEAISLPGKSKTNE
jgi:hypothetical protein